MKNHTSSLDDDKMLDWRHDDIERRFGFPGARYTDVGTVFSLSLSLVLFGLVFAGMRFLPQDAHRYRVVALVMDRGWTPWAMIFLATLAFVILLAKWRKLVFQSRAFGIEIIPSANDFALTSETAKDAIRRLRSFVDDPSKFVLFNRIERALLNLHNIGNVSDVSEMLRAQAENDESRSDSSYGILGGIVWAIPILGFIGTVVGLSGAIGKFGFVLNAESDIGSLKDGLAPVTENLGIAFDTTFLALVLAMGIQLFVTLLRKREERFLGDCRDYAHENVVARLRLAHDSADVAESGKR